MRRLTFEPAQPIDTDGMPWIPTGPGKSFRPLRFAEDGWSELMRLEPGSAVAVHRHAGEVHAFNLAGTREIFGTGERVGPGNYVYEPAGTIDGWAAIGEEPCVVPSKLPALSSISAKTARLSIPTNPISQSGVFVRGVSEAA